MSPKFNKVETYYDNGLWNKAMVANAVVKRWITAEEYELITGDPYERQPRRSVAAGVDRAAAQDSRRDPAAPDAGSR